MIKNIKDTKPYIIKIGDQFWEITDLAQSNFRKDKSGRIYLTDPVVSKKPVAAPPHLAED